MQDGKARSIALTIAGSDSSGGAGIQADLKTFGALGIYGASVITALTAQNTVGVQGVHSVPPDFVEAQLNSVLTDLNVGAVKTGMLANAGIISAVAAALENDPKVLLIVDPVMIATSGDPLLECDAITVMRDKLFPLATLITPNLDEAAALLGQPKAQSRDEMEEQAEALVLLGARSVLLKGGHFADDIAPREAADVLIHKGARRWYAAPWINTRNTHGTGCTLAAAIAAGCAEGQPIPEAVETAKRFLSRALAAGANLRVGQGNGPVDHLVDWKSPSS